MTLANLSAQMLPAIENELRRSVKSVMADGLEPFYGMLTYHMGWEGNEKVSQGKRIRPLLLLLVTAAAGGEWERALPAAAAVELVHNFSLIHDDIQDGSDLSRGRPTVWKLWGMPQAINAGDAMFAIAHLACLGLSEHVSLETTHICTNLLITTCIKLTGGQYLDISYETQTEITADAYWPMVEGKTAALISSCTEMGAHIAEADRSIIGFYREFGRSLGLAFQVQDDYLGIWGDAALTGKSAESDLVAGKKSLPVLYGLGQNGDFRARWLSGPITAEEVPDIAAMLESEGARQYTLKASSQLTRQALDNLALAEPRGNAGAALEELTHQLLNRNK